MQTFERDKAIFEQQQQADESIKQQQNQQLQNKYQAGRSLHAQSESSSAPLSSLRNELNEAGGDTNALRQEMETYKKQLTNFQRAEAERRIN